jgi:hypothetical protein
MECHLSHFFPQDEPSLLVHFSEWSYFSLNILACSPAP